MFFPLANIYASRDAFVATHIFSSGQQSLTCHDLATLVVASSSKKTVFEAYYRTVLMDPQELEGAPKSS